MYKNFLLDLEPRRSICFHTLLQKYWGKWTESWICHYSFARGAVWFYQYYRYYYSSVVENILLQKIALLNCTLDYQIIMKFNLVIEKQHIVFWEILGLLTWKCRIKNPSNEYDLQGSKKQTGLFEKPNFRFDKIELYLYVYFWTTVLMTVCTTLLSELETSFHRKKKTNTKKQTYCFDFFFHQKWMASLSYRKKALSKA